MTPLQVDKWKIEVGKRLRGEIRTRYGHRKEHLFAKCIGISQGSLSDINNGKSSPSALTLKKIHKSTSIDITYLLTGKKGGE